MSALFDLLECAPYDVSYDDEDDIQPVPVGSFLSFSSLFLESDSSTARRGNAYPGSSNVDMDEEPDDDDDSETIIWITPRPRPRKTDLEEPDDGFQLDGTSSPMGSEFSSFSSGSGEEFSSDEEVSTSRTGITSLDRPAAERELTDDQRHEDADEGFFDEGSQDTADDGDLSSDDEDESLLDALLKHEEQLGREFVYLGQPVNAYIFDTDESIDEIIYGVERSCETYVAAMRLHLKLNDIAEGGNIRQTELMLKVIQDTSVEAVLEWLYQDHEYGWTLGRARFALVGQLIRLRIIPHTYVAEIIEGMDGVLHLPGHMEALQALIRYAGPRICIRQNLDALDIVDEATLERPGDYNMAWLYKKITNDMTVYAYRNMLVDEYEGRLERDELKRLYESLIVRRP